MLLLQRSHIEFTEKDVPYRKGVYRNFLILKKKQKTGTINIMIQNWQEGKTKHKGEDRGIFKRVSKYTIVAISMKRRKSV